MEDTDRLAYDNAKAARTQTDDEDIDKTIKRKYLEYLSSTVPVPKDAATGVASETINNISQAKGILPKILQGLGGALKMANTSAGQNIIGGLQPMSKTAAGPAPFGAMAWGNTAGKTKESENAIKQGAIGQELERIKNLSGYGVESMKAKTEADKERFMQEEENRRHMEDIAEQEKLLNLRTGTEKEQKQTASFEEKRRNIYEANKNMPGAEEILNAKDETELKNIAITKGYKLLGILPVSGAVEKKTNITIKKIG